MTTTDTTQLVPDSGPFGQAPGASSRLKRAIAEDDMLALPDNLRTPPDDLGQAVADIIRVGHRRIVEHWDVMQPVLAEPSNDNGMFDRPQNRTTRGADRRRDQPE